MTKSKTSGSAVSEFLILLSGMNPDALRLCTRKDRNNAHFSGLSILLVGVYSLLTSSYAAYLVLDEAWKPFFWLPGIVWAVTIVVIDRMILSSLEPSPKGSGGTAVKTPVSEVWAKGKPVLLFLARAGLAAAIAWAISIPIVLYLFRTEIDREREREREELKVQKAAAVKTRESLDGKEGFLKTVEAERVRLRKLQMEPCATDECKQTQVRLDAARARMEQEQASSLPRLEALRDQGRVLLKNAGISSPEGLSQEDYERYLSFQRHGREVERRLRSAQKDLQEADTSNTEAVRRFFGSAKAEEVRLAGLSQRAFQSFSEASSRVQEETRVGYQKIESYTRESLPTQYRLFCSLTRRDEAARQVSLFIKFIFLMLELTPLLTKLFIRGGGDDDGGSYLTAVEAVELDRNDSTARWCQSRVALREEIQTLERDVKVRKLQELSTEGTSNLDEAIALLRRAREFADS
jgi:hypothetical protein